MNSFRNFPAFPNRLHPVRARSRLSGFRSRESCRLLWIKLESKSDNYTVVMAALNTERAFSFLSYPRLFLVPSMDAAATNVNWLTDEEGTEKGLGHTIAFDASKEDGKRNWGTEGEGVANGSPPVSPPKRKWTKWPLSEKASLLWVTETVQKWTCDNFLIT